MHGNERRRTRCIDGDARPFETQLVRDPSGCDAARAAGRHVAVQARQVVAREPGVLLVHQADEHARIAARHLLQRDARSLQRFPARLEQETLLWVHLHRFAWRDAEEWRVESIDVREEPAAARAHLPWRIRIRRVERVDIPPRAGHFGDGIHALVEQPPERLLIVHAARKSTAHADDRDAVGDATVRLVLVVLKAFLLVRRAARASRRRVARRSLGVRSCQMRNERGNGWVLVRDGRRQIATQPLGQVSAEADGRNRAQPETRHRIVQPDRLGGNVQLNRKVFLKPVLNRQRVRHSHSLHRGGLYSPNAAAATGIPSQLPLTYRFLGTAHEARRSERIVQVARWTTATPEAKPLPVSAYNFASSKAPAR